MEERRLRPLPSLLASTAAWLAYMFLILPSLVVVPMSFGDKDEFVFPPHSLSLYLYDRYFFESTWMQVTVQSLVVGLCSMIAALVLGCCAAYGLDRYQFPGKRALTLFLLSPIFVPAIVIALGLYLYLGRFHLVGTTPGLVVSHTIITMPFVIISVSAGLRHVDRDLETAAMVMGANRFLILRKVTLPLLRPALVAGGLFAFLISFDEVVVAYFITNVQTQTLPVKMYSSIHWEISPVLAAVSTLMTLLSLSVCLAVAFLQRNEQS
jgi:ABC-type spermidine/putrescine transport system permease subunit II